MESEASLSAIRRDGDITSSDSRREEAITIKDVKTALIPNEPEISVNDNQRPALRQRFMAHLFVDQPPIPETAPEYCCHAIGCYKICDEICCFEIPSKFPSLRTTKILIHFISLLFSIWDFTTDILVYQTLSSAQDMLKFEEPYFIFLIFSSFFFLAEIILCVSGIFGAAKTNKKIHPSHQFYIKAGLLICEDLPFSVIILFSMIRSGNCGYVVSMTYSKSAWWSSLATIFGCVWKLIWQQIHFHEALDYFVNRPILLRLVWLVLTKGMVTILIILGYYLDILATLMIPVSLLLIVTLLTVLLNVCERLQVRAAYPFVLAAFLKIARVLSPIMIYIYILCPFWFMAFATSYMASFTLTILTNLGRLANVSGCTVFTLNISALILFPIANSSTNCGIGEYYSMKTGISGISNGDGFLANNKMTVTGDCNQLLPMEFAGLYSVSSNDSCVVFASAMYSTQDFVPEFNIAFLIQKTSSYSVCVKPYVETGNITFSAPWIRSSKTVERVGKSYCGSDNFSACSMPEIGNQDLSPCFDCDRNCYSWVEAVEKNPIIFQSFEGWLIIRGEKYAMRYNVKLATHCDVNSDWKSEKLFCSPI